jgi:hypothetical protein
MTYYSIEQDLRRDKFQSRRDDGILQKGRLEPIITANGIGGWIAAALVEKSLLKNLNVGIGADGLRFDAAIRPRKVPGKQGDAGAGQGDCQNGDNRTPGVSQDVSNR